MTKGGKREGSGRKPLPDHEKKKRRIFWLTEAEHELLKGYLSELRRRVIRAETP